MSVSELINEIISEWAYRVDDGMPNPKNPTHLKELGIVLSEMKLSHIKEDLVKGLLGEAEEGGFQNPVLNKKVTYKNDKGEDKEGIVGNLLRQPKGTPARDAADKVLPPEGSPERDKLDAELGTEKDGKTKTPPEEGGADGKDEEEKQKAAAVMFDPKADPAMGARLDREKAASEKLAQKDKEDSEAEKAPTPGSPEDWKNKADKVAKDKEEAKKKGYDDSLHAMSDNQLDTAITDAEKKMHDAQKSGDDKAADKANTEYAQHKVEKEMRKASKSGDKEIADATVGNFLARKKEYEEKYGEPYKADIPYPDSDGGERTSAKWGGEEPTGPEAGPNAEPPANEPSKPDTTPPSDVEVPAGAETPSTTPSKDTKAAAGAETPTTPKKAPLDKHGFEKKGAESAKHPGKFSAGGDFYSSTADGPPEFEIDDAGNLQPISKESQDNIIKNNLNTTAISLIKKDIKKNKDTEHAKAVDAVDKEIANIDTQYQTASAEEKKQLDTKKIELSKKKDDIINKAAAKLKPDTETTPTTEPAKAADVKPEEPAKEEPAKEEPTKPEETPKATKDDIKKEKPGKEAKTDSGGSLYSVGGGYYSDKPNGPAKYVRTESVIEMAFDNSLNEDIFALFEKSITGTLQNGEKITVQELPPRAIKKATQRAKAAAAASSKEEPTQAPTSTEKPVDEPKGWDKYDAPKGADDKSSWDGMKTGWDGYEKPKGADDKSTWDKTPMPKGETPPPGTKKAGGTPPPPPPPLPTKKTDGTDVPGKFTPIETPPPSNEKGVEKDGKIAGTTIETEPSLQDIDPEFLKQKSTEMNKYYENFKEDKKKAEGIAREKMGYSEEQVKGLKGKEKEVYEDEVKKNQEPTYNLCKVSVPGSNLFCSGNKGIPREKMPQFKGEPVEGSQAWDVLQKAKETNPNETEANGEPYFRQMLADKGVKVTDAEVPSESLKATQSELVGDKVLGMKSVLDAGPSHPAYKKMTSPLYVSKDGYVVDGHHRWAAITAYNMEHPDKPLPLKAMIIDQDIDQAIETSNDFANEFGVAAKSGKQTGADSSKQTPTSAPNKTIGASAQKAIDKIKAGVKNWSVEEKEFFVKKVHKGNSPERRSFGEAFKDKAKGAWEAIKHGAEHEVHLFKSAGSGVKNFFSGGKVSDEEKKALIGVAKKVAIAAAFGAVGGGLAHGALAFGKHVMVEFIPHVVAETIAMGAGKAALFAGAEDDDADMMKFIEIISKKLESANIPNEIMADAVESYNQNKEDKNTNEMRIESLVKEIISEINLEAKGETFTAIKKDTGMTSVFKSKEARDAAVKGGTHKMPKGNKETPKKAPTQNMFTGDADYQKRLGKEKPAVNPTKVEPTQTATKPAKGARIIGGKDKTLAKVDTLKSKEFNQKQQPDAATFAEKNKAHAIPPPYKLPKELFQNSKVPARHLIALERMMNTKANNQTAKWSHFSDLPGGAGQISAQAGELMTMISTTLDDKQAASFFNSLLEHEKQQIAANPNLKSEGSRVVGNSWIKAAVNNRRAIRNRLSKEYPGATIEAGSWDTAGEVEAMGLKDYKKNKGFSTDAYFKIKTKDGQEILDEVSLKKSTAVNFLNSGTGKLFEWDPNIPDDINPNVYSKNQRKSLSDFGTANIKKLQNAVSGDAEFQALIKSKKIDLPSALAKLQAGKGSRDINKVVLSAITTLAKKGDKGALKYLQGVQDTHKAHQKAIISALGTNPKLKQGMLTAIREEFPLKAVGEGEESMAIGPNSLDRGVLKNIFETSNFDEIKQGLFAVTDEEPPYLAYKAGKKGRVIPIATIVAREDGVGYGGQIKFEMQLDKRFAKILEQANKNVYGG